MKVTWGNRSEQISNAGRVHASSFTAMTQTVLSSVVLRFPHAHTNAAESNTQYFIQGCKYYIKCSRPISVRSMLQNRAAVGVHSILNLPLCPQAARILDQDRPGVTRGYLTSALWCQILSSHMWLFSLESSLVCGAQLLSESVDNRAPRYYPICRNAESAGEAFLWGWVTLWNCTVKA